MVPDFEYFLRGQTVARWSHSMTGLFTWCLPVGLATLALWELLAKDGIVRLLSVAPTSGARSPAWLVAGGIGLLLGAVTHLVWDGFTHEGGWGARLVPGLRSPAIILSGRNPPIPWGAVADHISTVVGGVIVTGWLVLKLQRAGAWRVLVRPTWRWGVLVLIAAIAVAAGLWNASGFPMTGSYWKTELWLGRAAVGGLAGLGCAIMSVGIALRLTGVSSA